MEGGMRRGERKVEGGMWRGERKCGGWYVARREERREVKALMRGRGWMEYARKANLDML